MQPQSSAVDGALAHMLQAHAADQWDAFYKHNRDRFFKDRHYLAREFPLLEQPQITVLEVGCGTGSTALPLAALNTSATILACDYAQTAVDLLRSSQDFDAQRMHAFVADITSSGFPALLPESAQGQVDVINCIFVLSANSPARVSQAIGNLKRTLRPGSGAILVRDYAVGDLAELRLAQQGRRNKLGEHFYVRGDGTQCLYFSQEQLCELFQEHGFVCRDVRIHERRIANRKSAIAMHRRWLQAVFALPPGPDPALCKPAASFVPEVLHRVGDGEGDAKNVCHEDCSTTAQGGDPSALPNAGVLKPDSSAAAIEATLASIWRHAQAAMEQHELETDVQRADKQVPACCLPPRDGVCITAAERALAHWMCHNPEAKNRRVLDIGSGLSGMCGVAAVRSQCRSYTYLVSSQGDVGKQLLFNLRHSRSHVVSERLIVHEFREALLGSACSDARQQSPADHKGHRAFDLVVMRWCSSLNVEAACNLLAGVRKMVADTALLLVLSDDCSHRCVGNHAAVADNDSYHRVLQHHDMVQQCK